MKIKKLVIFLIVLAAIVGVGVYAYISYQKEMAMRYPKFYSGNGRLEATEVYVSAKIAGRIEKIYVKEGDLVHKGDKLVQMQTNALQADRAATQAMIKVQEGEFAMAKATVLQKQSILSGADKEYKRQLQLRATNANSQRDLENAETNYQKAVADLEYAKANVIAAEARIAQKKAELLRIEEDIKDSLLIATYDGRIQYLLAHDGEVLAAGGRAMNLVNLTDTYMTFFLPTNIAGQVQMGSEVKLVFDAAPDYVVDAKVTFIDPIAQFTPKSVETKVEREKLMFRIKASLNAESLRKYIADVKTGLPGVAYVKIDPKADWSETPVHGKILIGSGTDSESATPSVSNSSDSNKAK